MRALLVYPRFPKSFWSFEKTMELIGKRAVLPPLGLITVAALLPDDCRHSRDRIPDQDHPAEVEHHRGHGSNPPTGQDCLGTCAARCRA